jgi:hypothetical protein
MLVSVETSEAFSQLFKEACQTLHLCADKIAQHYASYSNSLQFIISTMKTFNLLALVLFSGLAGSALDGTRYLWFDEPGTDWETGTLITGCGRLGISVFGGLDEVVTINEDSIWSGPIQHRVPPNGDEYVTPVRNLLLNGNITEGGDMCLQKMTPTQPSERQYSYFGNLQMYFGHGQSVENYSRWLDTRQGNIVVSYKYQGVDYK